VNFNSPLLWDVFAISTYFSVSLVFWYIGLIPDFATIRDKVTKPGHEEGLQHPQLRLDRQCQGLDAFRGGELGAGRVATPLVFSVHSVVSFDFATSVIPGWHTTIFPPYFVSGAVFSGFAMVQTLLLVMRKVMKLGGYITRSTWST
jgi:Ni/Fe-hydrogenase subunit HybB-like protein